MKVSLVSLDLFHAAQRILSKLSKANRPRVNQNHGDSSIRCAYKKFKLKWKDVHYGGQQVITPNVVKELQKHMVLVWNHWVESLGEPRPADSRLFCIFSLLLQLMVLGNFVFRLNEEQEEMKGYTSTFFKHNLEPYGGRQSGNECFGGVSSLPEPPSATRCESYCHTLH